MSYNSGWFRSINNLVNLAEQGYTTVADAVSPYFVDHSHQIIRNIKNLDYPEEKITVLGEVVDLNSIRDEHNRPILHMLVEDMDDPQYLNRLRHSSINFDGQDDNGQTALHFAVRLEKTSFIKALLKLGASPEVLNRNRRSTLHYSILSNDKKSFNLMLPYCHHLKDIHYEGEQPLLIAIRNGRRAIFNALLGKGCDINFRCNDKQRTPIEEAVEENQLEFLKRMCERMVIWHFHKQLLHLAVTNYSTEILSFLLDQQLNPNEYNQLEMTPLEFAIYKKKREAIYLLSCKEQLSRLNERNKKKCLNAAILAKDYQTIKCLAKDSYIKEKIRELCKVETYFGKRLKRILKKGE